MGCSFSRSRSGDLNSRVFRVYNVDEQGQELNPGKIEVSDTELILIQKGKEAIRWPLRCLRRYGFDAELFSFESGRRCPTGAGIYAFKCRNAEALFNTVQDCIQRAGQEDSSRVSHNILPPSSRPNSRPQSMVDTPIDMDGMFMTNRTDSVTSNGSAHHYINGTINNDLHEYINTGSTATRTGCTSIDNAAALMDLLHNGPLPPAEPDHPQVTYAVLDLESTENLAETLGEESDVIRRDSGAGDSRHSLSIGGAGAVGVDDIGAVSPDGDEEGGAACPTYVNVVADCPQTVREKPIPNGAAVKQQSEPNYANLDLGEHSPPPRSRHKEILKVNYITLDLKNQPMDNGTNGASASPTSPTSFGSFPESPCRKTDSYAMIDFNKTAALLIAAKNVDDSRGGSGGRKTRHNSVITDMP
ncbi:fibroblast growth factor receptor substrate 3-like [Haliotis asinina]|uniref:fibroblast growth factor receptor substrate 3-like n=1 Tax=Haliotis asinina TaxID=109174 RepID=UPI00353185A5